MSRDEVIQLSVRIDTLRKELAKLGEIQRDLRGLEKQLDVVLGLSEPASQEVDETLMGRVVGLLNANGERDYDAEGLLAVWPQEHIASIRSALSRALGMGKISRTTRGRYRAVAKAAEGQEIGLVA